ncbi:MAG TPA: hypothetical protein VMH37_04405 [Candidatus Binataceae bacterium]|nr:hypothetical protein [Candidatus Binataceae bacterium]
MWWQAIVFYAWVAIEAIRSITLAQATAVVTAYIALQQWLTNKRRVRLETYDRRLRVYRGVIDFMTGAMRTGVSEDALVTYRSETSEASFLFPRKIQRYVEDIYAHGVALGAANDEKKKALAGEPGFDRQAASNKAAAEVKWMLEQFKIAEDAFRSHLDVSSW